MYIKTLPQAGNIVKGIFSGKNQLPLNKKQAFYTHLKVTLCKVIAYFCDEWGKFFERKDTRQVNALDASSNNDNSVNESNHNYNYNNFAEQETQLLPVQNFGAINGQNTHSHTRIVKNKSHWPTHSNTYKTWRWFSEYPMSLPVPAPLDKVPND